MVRQSAGPSSKALGKRPVRNGVSSGRTKSSSLSAVTSSADSPIADDETHDTGSSSRTLNASASTSVSVGNGNGIQTRSSSLNHTSSSSYKRVLPLRMRRGGVGSLVGTNEIDVNLLDMLKRKGENEPLIPARSVFILTTDSRLVPPASTSEIGLNNLANERYFERPEVIKAYKIQQDVQVPKFWQLEEDVVGGRLRTRSGETESYELTDEAYEKRHRKHEMNEKRQRLREKEKLQHEHYKLKERIEQLRNMDPNAFLALPSDVFDASAAPIESSDSLDGMQTENSIGTSTFLHEAERRRKIMLNAALSLEERYRTLLPTEKKLADTRNSARRASASIEPSIADEDVLTPEQKPLKLKLSTRASGQPTPPPTAGTESPSRKRKGTSAPRDFSPQLRGPNQLEESTVITTLRSASSRQTRSRAGQKPRSSRPATPHLIEQALANHVSRISLSDRTPDVTNRQDLSSVSSHKGVSVQEAPSTNASTDRRRHARAQADQHLNVIQYNPLQDHGPSRKKKKAAHKAEQTADLVDGAPESLTDIRHSVSASSELIQVQDASQAEHPLTPPVSQQDRLTSEPAEADMPIQDMTGGPSTTAGKAAKTSSSVPPDEHESFPQLRFLEKPDEYDEEIEVDVTHRPVNETSAANEPITPPVEQGVTADSIIAESRSASFVTAVTPAAAFEGPASKRRKLSLTPSSQDHSSYRELSTSVPLLAELELSYTEPTSLSIIDLHSYEIPTTAGKGRKPKPLPALLDASKHNVEPGRKTGRSVKAFGVEVPSFGVEEFEIPRRLIREVLGVRKVDDRSDSGSNGDPPSFTDGMAHGEAFESISTLGKRRSTERR